KVGAAALRRRVLRLERGAPVVLLEDDLHRALEDRARRAGARREPGVELLGLRAEVLAQRAAAALQGDALLQDAGAHFRPAGLLFHGVRSLEKPGERAQERDRGCAEQHEKQGDARDQRGAEEAARALGGARPLEPGVEQAHVLLVRLPRRVEEIARDRDDADDALDADVERHAQQQRARRAEARGLVQDVARKHDADEIADEREQADDGVYSDREARPRHRDRAVEEPREPLQARTDVGVPHSVVTDRQDVAVLVYVDGAPRRHGGPWRKSRASGALRGATGRLLRDPAGKLGDGAIRGARKGACARRGVGASAFLRDQQGAARDALLRRREPRAQLDARLARLRRGEALAEVLQLHLERARAARGRGHRAQDLPAHELRRRRRPAARRIGRDLRAVAPRQAVEHLHAVVGHRRAHGDRSQRRQLRLWTLYAEIVSTNRSRFARRAGAQGAAESGEQKLPHLKPGSPGPGIGAPRPHSNASGLALNSVARRPMRCAPRSTESASAFTCGSVPSRSDAVVPCASAESPPTWATSARASCASRCVSRTSSGSVAAVSFRRWSDWRTSLRLSSSSSFAARSELASRFFATRSSEASVRLIEARFSSSSTLFRLATSTRESRARSSALSESVSMKEGFIPSVSPSGRALSSLPSSRRWT